MDVMVDIRFIESLQKIWLGKNACIPSRVNSLTPKNCQSYFEFKRDSEKALICNNTI